MCGLVRTTLCFDSWLYKLTNSEIFKNKMFCPKTSAQPTEKGKGKSTTPTKGKTSSAQPSKKQNQGESISTSQAEELQVVVAMEVS